MARLVLVVEDDLMLRTGLTALIGSDGHPVVGAATVAEGMERLKVDPSHLLLDMNLSDGVGTTILRHVREHRLPVKVAVLSGSGDDVLMSDMQSLRPDAIFRKPPDWDAAMAWITA